LQNQIKMTKDKIKPTLQLSKGTKCSYCKKELEDFSLIYICKDRQKVFCYDCEHKANNQVLLCGYKFEEFHEHQCNELDLKK